MDGAGKAGQSQGFSPRDTMTHSFTKKQIGLAVACALAAALAAATLGCPPTPAAAAVVIKDRIYTVTPDALKVTAGIVTGEVTEMKVTERVEEGSGRVATPPRRHPPPGTPAAGPAAPGPEGPQPPRRPRFFPAARPAGSRPFHV